MDSLSVFTENLFSFARMLGSKFGGGMLAGPSKSLAAASGLPYAGENYLLLLPKASAFEAEQLLSFFAARDLTFVAPVMPGIPSNLVSALETKNVLPVRSYTAMTLDLSRAPLGGEQSPLQTVKDEKDADEWGRVVWRGFDGGEDVAEDYLALARHLASHQRNSLYLLTEGGKPVSCGLLHQTKNSCGLYYFATPPEFRRLGYAKRLMRALAGKAAQGYSEMVLLATPEGLPFYLNFGFKALAEIPMRSNSRNL